MILLFTDFGWDGPYVGQVKTVLAEEAPDVPVIDILHDAPPHDPRAAAYLLAALVAESPAEAVWLAVVDPGVGGDRPALALEADGRWFVGPGNGLFEIVQRRARTVRVWTITWRPRRLSASFHGRDLFAPAVARIARGDGVPGEPATGDWGKDPHRPGASWPDELAEIIYADRFGNLMIGLEARDLPREAVIVAAGRRIHRARTFVDVSPGQPFWYENSIGLVEIAASRASAARLLGLGVGARVTVERNRSM